MPPPKGRYQVRYRGINVHGAYFDELRSARRFANAYPAQTIFDTQEGRIVPILVLVSQG